MAKKTGKPPANARQQKIQAAQKSGGTGANKIVIATVVAVVAIVAVVGGVIWSEQSKKDAITGGGNALPAGVAALGDGYPAFQDVTAASGAPTLALYEDFQCPACKQFEAAFGQTVTDLAQSGKVKLEYHIKNFLDDNLGNDSSTRAANAAFCAADAGKFQEYHNQLYANQPQEGVGFSETALTTIAKNVGLSGDALSSWESCYKANKYVDYVRSVETSSAKQGVTGTPTIRINGEDWAYTTGSTPADLEAAVAAATK
jgi:protein-disulfide isomerase